MSAMQDPQADGETLYREFGMTAEAVVAAARESIAN